MQENQKQTSLDKAVDLAAKAERLESEHKYEEAVKLYRMSSALYLKVADETSKNS